MTVRLPPVRPTPWGSLVRPSHEPRVWYIPVSLPLRLFGLKKDTTDQQLLALRSFFISFRQKHNSRCRHVQHVRNKVIWHRYRSCTLTVTAQLVASGRYATLQKISQGRIVRLPKRWDQSVIKTSLDQGFCCCIITVSPASLGTNCFHYALKRFQTLAESFFGVPLSIMFVRF